MKIFFYPDTDPQDREITDLRILESVKTFCEENEMPYPEDAFVLRTEIGKPYLYGLPLCVGVTHAGDYLLVGVSRKPFGLDAEPYDRKIRDYRRILEKYYTPVEQAKIMKKPEEEQIKKFISLWVRKEAWLKFRGLGLSDLALADTMNAEGLFIQIPHDTLCIYIYAEQDFKKITLR